MFEELLGIVAIVLFAGLCSVIFRKAGYSGLLGILMVVPVANIIWFIAFTFLEWPVHREASRLRLAFGQGSEADASSVLGQATRLEQRGDWSEAIALCELVAERMQGQPAADDARRVKESIQQRQRLGGL
ncbi:MAG: hypothetical protein JXB13_07830 [Phycisphaerae bacterium]|nr:hypothetical protein [Phycisphaerae bacterium]